MASEKQDIKEINQEIHDNFLLNLKVLKETGNINYLKEKIPWANNQGSGTVLEHLEKSIDFTKKHCGKHGIPLSGECQRFIERVLPSCQASF
jgi:cellobiose phosphorylase